MKGQVHAAPSWAEASARRRSAAALPMMLQTHGSSTPHLLRVSILILGRIQFATRGLPTRYAHNDMQTRSLMLRGAKGTRQPASNDTSKESKSSSDSSDDNSSVDDSASLYPIELRIHTLTQGFR